MSELVLPWPDPPGLPDLATTPLTVGVQFSLSSNAPVLGVQWRVPDTLPDPGAPDSVIALWDDVGALLTSANVTWLPAMAGNLTSFYFAAPFAGIAGTIYRASIFTRSRYVATVSQVWPKTNGILTATATNGWFAAGASFPNSLSGNAATYHVSPIIQIADDTTAVLDAAMPAMVVDVEGEAEPVEAVLDATMPAMAVDIVATSPIPPIPPISPDRMNFGPVLTALLDCVCDALSVAEVPICTCIITTGPPTADYCNCACPDGSGSGQLGIYVASTFLSASFPTPAPPESIDKACGPAYLVANIVVEILRCAPTSDMAGNAPPAADLIAATLAAMTDASLVRQAVGCCLVGLKTERTIPRFSIGQQVTIEPQGGCAGSSLAIQVALPACICAGS